MQISFSVDLRIESCSSLCMLGNVFILPSSFTNSLGEYKIPSCGWFPSASWQYCYLVFWHQLLLMTNRLPDQLLYFIVLCHFAWQLLRFFSLIIIFISYFGLRFIFTFASWNFIFILRMAKGLDIICSNIIFLPIFPSVFYVYLKLQFHYLLFVQ